VPLQIERVLLAPRGAGSLPLSDIDRPSANVRADDLGLSSQLVWELRAWAGRSRETPPDELVFRVQAHRLAADIQVEVGLATTVFCLEADESRVTRERSRGERAAAENWRAIPLRERLVRFPRLGLTQEAFDAPEVLPVVAPDVDGVVGHRVKIMEEWSVEFPVWANDDVLVESGWIGLLSPENLPVEPQLVARLEAWNGEWESWHPSVLGDVPDPLIPYEVRLEHVVEGHRMAAELQAACGPELFVLYPPFSA
jgi:hypothetical protein